MNDEQKVPGLLSGSFSFDGEMTPELQAIVAKNPPILHAHFKKPVSRWKKAWVWLTRPLRVKRLVLKQPVTVSFLDWSSVRRGILQAARKRKKFEHRRRLHRARLQRWYRNVSMEHRGFLLRSDIERVFGVGDVRPKMSWRQSIREETT